MSHEIDKQSLSIFFARKCDFWRQWIQWIYIELYIYPQAIARTYMNFNRYPWANVWNYMNFNIYPHIGRGPPCRWQSSSVKPLWLHSMHFTRAFPFIHWCRCKLLASMWISLASFILKLSMWVSLEVWNFCFAWENARWTLPGIDQRMLWWTPVAPLQLVPFVEADIDCFASTPTIIRLAIAKQACKFPAVHTVVHFVLLLSSWKSRSHAKSKHVSFRPHILLCILCSSFPLGVHQRMLDGLSLVSIRECSMDTSGPIPSSCAAETWIHFFVLSPVRQWHWFSCRYALRRGSTTRSCLRPAYRRQFELFSLIRTIFSLFEFIPINSIDSINLIILFQRNNENNCA